MNIGGLPATLLDTAGIRSETDDEVEKIGVERSRAAAAGADIVVLVVDAERGWVSEDSAFGRVKSRITPARAVHPCSW